MSTVSMILQIMSDIKYFLVVLAVALTGFALAFWVISYPDDTLAFGTISNAFLNAYLYMLGQNISMDFQDTASPQLGVFLLVMFMLFMMILMLNLLIALMGDSFSNMKSRSLAHWQRERAEIMLEQYSKVPKSLKDTMEVSSHIHILKPFGIWEEGGDEAANSDEASWAQGARKTQSGVATTDSRADAGLRDRLAALEHKMDRLLTLVDKKSSAVEGGEGKGPFATAAAASEGARADKRTSVVPTTTKGQM
jgi:hypothetical protein